MFHKCKTKEEVKSLFRKLASFLHPDKGGCQVLMILLQDAKDEAMKAIEGFEEFCENKGSNYETQTEDIYDGDERLKIIGKIFKYAEKHKKFSTSFVESVYEFLDDKGYITSSQFNALTRVYYSFRMDDD